MSKNQLWGGRFATGPAELMTRINASIDTDKRLYRQDIRGSRAHVQMLARQGIVREPDMQAILDGLTQIEQEISDGNFRFDHALEDIHMHIEARLSELIGEPAGRLHTARSRNDQVATDLRLWLRDAIDELDAALMDFQAALIDKAAATADLAMPGLTHMQSAQPVSFGHHLLAYVEMTGRDRGRLSDCRRRLNECPLGAAALAGTPFPIDREATARDLGFAGPTANSMDSVAARDFALEFLAAGAICTVHLSRLAEEIVIWMSDGFGFLRLGDAWTTGSSIMPQKRNPDAAELVRAMPGRLLGALTQLAVVLKGLPMTYGKDMQEDKAPVFAAADTLQLAVAAMAGMVRDMTPDAATMRAALNRGFPTATDLADWLVREAGLSFREAHHLTGELVALAEGQGCGLAELELSAMQELESRITKHVYSVLTPEASMASRNSFGGTAPARVRAAVDAARARFLTPAREPDT